MPPTSNLNCVIRKLQSYIGILGLVFFISSCEKETSSTIIHNALLVDGTGGQAIIGSLRIENDRIVALGQLQPKDGEKIIDASGLVLSPGFIDTHSHHDWDTLRTTTAAISQGITTIVVGQDGGMNYPLSAYFDSITTYPLSVNVASYAGHNVLRSEVMGTDYKRHATPAEIDEMKSLLEKEMASGALGLSTGLEYDPGNYSNSEEVIELAKVAAAYDGLYISHMRSEDIHLAESIEEIIAVGKEAALPVQISHFKVIGREIWGTAPQFVKRLEEARSEGVDITADVYPYEYWQSTMKVLFLNRDFDNYETAKFALTELTRPEWVIIANFAANRSYEGKLLSEVAELRGEDPANTLMNLISLSEKTPGESIIAKSMIDEDIRTLLSWSHSNVCSDGAPSGHPRGWGAFPKFFNMMSGMSLEERVYKMTGLSAQHMRFNQMGTLKEGHFADLVLFDPTELKDMATFDIPNIASQGIHTVWVNGKVVFQKGKASGRTPGRVIKRAG